MNAFDCLLSYCSEAAVFLSDTATVALQGCNVEECSHAFVSGYGFGDMLQVCYSYTACRPSLLSD